eukprot:361624_1
MNEIDTNLYQYTMHPRIIPTHTHFISNYNSIDQKSKDIVFGYINRMQTMFPMDNTYYNIPSIIPYLCLNYYFDAWTKESIEWKWKLKDVANTFEDCSMSIRKKVWDKFDKHKKGELDTDKSLKKLLYALIALRIKSKDRQGKVPSYKSLQHLLKYIVKDISEMIENKKTIKKTEFTEKICNYLKKISTGLEAV